MATNAGILKWKLSELAQRLRDRLMEHCDIIRIGSVTDIPHGPREPHAQVLPLGTKPRFVAVLLTEPSQRTTFLLEDADEEELRQLHQSLSAALPDLLHSAFPGTPRAAHRQPDPPPTDAAAPAPIMVTFAQRQIYEFACALDPKSHGVDRLGPRIAEIFGSTGRRTFRLFISNGVFVRIDRLTRVRHDVPMRVVSVSRPVQKAPSARLCAASATSNPDSS